MVTARIAEFGRNAQGEAVSAITLDAGRVRVVILTRGGAVAEFWAPDRQGQLANIVLGRGSFAEWDRGGSFNTLVGRYAGRISGGGFSLDGQFHPLRADPQTGICSHGGAGAGWGTKLWTPSLFERDDAAGVVLRLDSPDGDNGFPGAIAVAATWTLFADGALQLDWHATTTRPTHINVTSHLYFNLAGQGAATIDGHRLRLAASRYVELDDRMIPTGELAAVAGTPLDFRDGRPVGPALRSGHPQILLARGLDHTLVIDGASGQLRPAAELVDPASGRQLRIETTEPALQVFSANNFNGSQPSASGGRLRQGDGLALETQHIPDSPNQPGFPSTRLDPGTSFTSTTRYCVGLAG